MTARPYRPDELTTLAETVSRARRLERKSCGPWVYVGLGILQGDGTYNPDLPDDVTGIGTVTVPAFQNGWVNSGGGLQKMRFRWILDGGVDIQGSATGGIAATSMWTMPAGPYYRPDDAEVRLTASDDAGNLVVIRLLAAGAVIAGI